MAEPTLVVNPAAPIQPSLHASPKWLRPALGVFDILGGVAGILMGILFLAPQADQLGTMIVLGIVALMYCYSIWCGIAALKCWQGWREQNLILWFMQVPVISSPVFTY